MVASALIRASGLYEPCHLLKDLISPPELLFSKVFPMVQEKNVVEGLFLRIPMPYVFLLKIGLTGVESRVRVRLGPRGVGVVGQSL